ncbi:acetylornithine aminotransferase [Nephila pilipes]|uniref:acetylornithine transaminase n=1 Tax=Nephila pilipes TaxID=299642 RepID=A0A8X6NZ53_NEPPI|nr:acetylornithine aminotransferase [Nephila pilipes]
MDHVVSAYNRLDTPIVRGAGAYLFDKDGKKYLDFAAGISTTSLGHCHPYITDKLKEQLSSLWHCSNIFTIPEQERLADRLTTLTFADKVFFCSSGLEATEAAIKFIRRYFYSKGQAKRNRIITIEGGFHGRSIAAISAGGSEKSREGFAPLLSGFDKVPRNDIKALEKKISDETAAVFLEPIQSEGGVYPLDVEYLQKVRKITKAQGIILCFDEVQCGYGRIGFLFYYQNVGIEPDMLTCAKAMGNGFPIAACLVKDYIAEAITPGTHGSTYGGNPLAMTVGNAVLDIMLKEGFFDHVKRISKYLKEKLLPLAKEFPEMISEVRGKGLLMGIELATPVADKIISRSLDKGAEIGLTSISRSRVNKLKLDGNKRARIIDRLLNRKELTIGTVLLGNTIINITCSAVFTAIFINLFGNEGILLSTIIMTFCILLFCEVLPKTYAIQNPEKFASFSAYFVLFFVKIFSPLTLGIQFIVNLILKLCGLHKDKEVISAADAMRNMITLHRSEGTMLQQDLDMLSSILDLAETEISQIMTHRRNLFSLDIDRNKEELIREILTSSHSRVPLWQKEPDNIVGVIHVKDLINALREKDSKTEEVDIAQVMSRPWFIPESTPLSVQLHNFRKNRKHLAFVIDEYGALQGIVTLEDILEEIVGEISDEHDLITENFIKKISDNMYHIEGKSTIRNINRQLHWNLPDEEATTLAGMIVNEIERIPDEGEEFSMYGFRFKILKKDKNIITVVEVQVKTGNTSGSN